MNNHPIDGYESQYFNAATPGAGTLVGGSAGKKFCHTICWEAGANAIQVYDGAVLPQNLKDTINAGLVSGCHVLDIKFLTELRIVTTGAFGVCVTWTTG